MAFQERREFDKFLKFLTAKVVQTVVQSRRGERVRTRSTVNGNDWFNLSVPDDKQVSVELKRSLEGRLPSQDCPVCLEILMDTAEGDSVVLENWVIDLDTRSRDVGVSVSHVLYPRLALMLKSAVCVSRTTPAYRYSRQADDGNKFNFRVYNGPPTVPRSSRDFKHVTFATTKCPYGNITFSLSYRTTLTLHGDSSINESVLPTQQFSSPNESETGSLKRIPIPFVSEPHHLSPAIKAHSHEPFSAVLPREVDRQESTGTVQSEGEVERLDSLSVTQEQEGYLVVDVGEIKPAFVSRTSSDELSELLQQCNEGPNLDMFTEGSMDVSAAMDLINSHSMDT